MHDLNPGFVVGSYRIIRELGKGGMGAVYEVEHVTLGVHYALKTYQPKRKRNRLSFQRTVLHSGDSVELIQNY